MKVKARTILTGLSLALLLAVPLGAQGVDEPRLPVDSQPEQEATPSPAPAAPQQAASADSGTEATASGTDTAEELPRTASPLAALVLAGVGGVGAAIGLRAARRGRE